jgi:hypothetical protein
MSAKTIRRTCILIPALETFGNAVHLNSPISTLFLSPTQTPSRFTEKSFPLIGSMTNWLSLPTTILQALNSRKVGSSRARSIGFEVVGFTAEDRYLMVRWYGIETPDGQEGISGVEIYRRVTYQEM